MISVISTNRTSDQRHLNPSFVRVARIPAKAPLDIEFKRVGQITLKLLANGQTVFDIDRLYRAWPAIGGLGKGLAGALYLARFMAPLVYGIETHDPATFAIALALLVGRR